MERLYNGFTLQTPPGVFPLGTDSMVLADFIRLGRQERVLDLGAGCGTLGLLLCAKSPGCTVTGIEIDPASHRAAVDNIRANGLDARMESICADLRHITGQTVPGQFTICVSNPPYFPAGPASRMMPAARREDTCAPEDLFSAAARALKYGGDLYIVHRPERLAQLCACAAAESLQPKRLCLVRHKPAEPVSIILLQCRKGAKPGLLWQEMCLFGSDGSPTEDYKRIYHL